MGIYFEQSGSEAAAAALLGASINYPMRGAVTWKSVVGTNVASDALSHVASAGRDRRRAHRDRRGLRRGRLHPPGAHPLGGAQVERSRSSIRATACRSFAAVRARKASASPRRATSRSSSRIRIRACHMRGTLRVPGQRAPGDQHALAARRAELQHRADQPAALHLRDGGAEVRGSACRRRGATSSSAGSTSTVRAREDAARASSCRAASGTRPCAACTCSGLADVHGRTPIPLLVLNACTRSCPRS